MTSSDRLVALEAGESRHSSNLSGHSGRVPMVWAVFLHMIAALVILGSLGTLGSGVFSITGAETIRALPATGASLLIVATLAAGICDVISIYRGTHKTVKIWTGVHVGLFVAMIVFVIMIAASEDSLWYWPLYVGGGIGIFFHLVFCCVYGPLIAVKNLQKIPACKWSGC